MTDWDKAGGRPETPQSRGAVFAWMCAGIGIVLLMHGTAGVIFALLTAAGGQAASMGLPYQVSEWPMLLASIWAMGIGCTQGAYVLPAFAVAWVVRRPVALGIAVGAALTFLLNGACYGFVFFALQGANFH